MDEARLPTALLVDAIFRQCDIDFIPYYIAQKGEHSSGILLIKLNALDGRFSLRTQQRDFESGTLVWVDALSMPQSDEAQIDSYISRSISRDPDLWVIEFESRDLTNPFEKMGV